MVKEVEIEQILRGFAAQRPGFSLRQAEIAEGKGA
jgi:hypothetical protein